MSNLCVFFVVAVGAFSNIRISAPPPPPTPPDWKLLNAQIIVKCINQSDNKFWSLSIYGRGCLTTFPQSMGGGGAYSSEYGIIFYTLFFAVFWVYWSWSISQAPRGGNFTRKLYIGWNNKEPLLSVFSDGKERKRTFWNFPGTYPGSFLCGKKLSTC